MMELLNVILLGALVGLSAFHWFKIRKLNQLMTQNNHLFNDLSFKHRDAMSFLETQIARVHYDLLKRTNQRTFKGDMKLNDALSKPGAKEVLIKRKLIKRKDKGPFEGTLAQRARQSQLSLEPILIALNDLEAAP